MTKHSLGMLIAASICAASAQAEFSCGGPLTETQVRGFEVLFKPAYSPALTKMGATVADGNFSKKLTAAQLKSLTVDKPIVAATATLGEAEAKFLKKALNDNAQSSVPGWFSTVIGAFVPQAWVGITADVMIQLINGKGDAGRLSLANIAGTVGPGGNVSVVERVGKDKNGVQKFIWAYSHTANLNGKPTTALLYACAADIVPVP